MLGNHLCLLFPSELVEKELILQKESNYTRLVSADVISYNSPAQQCHGEVFKRKYNTEKDFPRQRLMFKRNNGLWRNKERTAGR